MMLCGLGVVSVGYVCGCRFSRWWNGVELWDGWMDIDSIDNIY